MEETTWNKFIFRVPKIFICHQPLAGGGGILCWPLGRTTGSTVCYQGSVQIANLCNSKIIYTHQFLQALSLRSHRGSDPGPRSRTPVPWFLVLPQPPSSGDFTVWYPADRGILSGKNRPVKQKATAEYWIAEDRQNKYCRIVLDVSTARPQTTRKSAVNQRSCMLNGT